MGTFIISIVFFFLLSALIFQKRLKENVFLTIVIIFFGTIVSTTIIGSILIDDVQYEAKLVKTIALKLKTSKLTDSINIRGYIYVDSIGSYHDIIFNDLKFSSKDEVNKLTFKYLEKGDSIPKYERYIDIPSISSKWIRARNFPKENKQYIVYIPNDSIHHILVDIANDITKKFNDED